MRSNMFAAALTAAGLVLLSAPAIAQVSEPPLTATPRVEDCGEDSRPETGMQGRVSQADHDAGLAAAGFTCNTVTVGSHKTLPQGVPTFGSIGGFKVHRYVDEQGTECAYYDSTLLFPSNIGDAEGGVIVLDMTDPSNPVQTMRLVTPAMLQPHETLVISQERGIIGAFASTLQTNPGTLEIYDISQDCTLPILVTAYSAVSPQGVPLLGHESGLSEDGMTFWVASNATSYVFAVDISNLLLPELLYVSQAGSHGLNISTDGTRTYLTSGGDGIEILDTSDIVNRVDDPQVTTVSKLTWESKSIPQNAVPFTNNGKEYLFEVDEFGSCSRVGAARIIDINDDANPFVLSNARLEVHDPANFDEICDDPGTSTPILQGYAGHYCHVPTRVDPTIAACSFIGSGLRIFDITDPARPVEVAYFNAPVTPRPAFSTPATLGIFESSTWAMSAPAFAPERKEIWYSDAFQGFFAVQVTNDMWPDTLADGIHEREDVTILAAGTGGGVGGASVGADTSDAAAPGSSTDQAAVSDSASGSPLAATGAAGWLQALGGIMLFGAFGVRGSRRRRGDGQADAEA